MFCTSVITWSKSPAEAEYSLDFQPWSGRKNLSLLCGSLAIINISTAFGRGHDLPPLRG
jgi:hypothetical protein